MNNYDVIIVGAGPAGLTAAIYALRAGRKILVLENGAVGGTVFTTEKIENYPGFDEIDGYTLAEKMRLQVEGLGAEIMNVGVSRYDLESRRLVLENGNEISGSAIVLAMGAKAKKLGLKNEDELSGQGISYCATCDGMFFKNKVVAVAGSTPRAINDAKYLCGIAQKVYLITTKSLEIQKDEKLEILEGFKVVSASGKPLSEIEAEDAAGKRITLKTSGLFVAVGFEPNTFGLGGVKLDSKGFIITDDNMKTGLAGVYAAGDIRAKTLRQIVTACADGAIAGHFAAKKVQNI